jgi:hypothetical protein
MRLRALVLAGLLLLLAQGPAGAESPAAIGPADRRAILSVIGEQLEAFRRDDGAAAFAFASPGIRAQFRDPETFMAMVRSGYRPVYRPREVEFRDLVELAGRLTQRVLLVGPDGVAVVAHYFMQRQPDGSWRIDGCILKGADDLTT